MTYVVWVGNRTQGDGTSNWVLPDGTGIWMGVPVDLDEDQRKLLESNGLIIEESSAEDAEAAAPKQNDDQPVGSDVVGTGPTFGESQTDQPSGRSGKSDKK